MSQPGGERVADVRPTTGAAGPELLKSATPASSLNPLERAHLTARVAARQVADAIRPLVPDDPDFRMLLTVSIRGRSIRVETKPEPYRDDGFRDSSG